MYGGSNEVFGKNENFPLVLDIKLHLKIPVNYQLQISPPPYHRQRLPVLNVLQRLAMKFQQVYYSTIVYL